MDELLNKMSQVELKKHMAAMEAEQATRAMLRKGSIAGGNANGN
jgi:hypothetical protein